MEPEGTGERIFQRRYSRSRHNRTQACSVLCLTHKIGGGKQCLILLPPQFTDRCKNQKQERCEC